MKNQNVFVVTGNLGADPEVAKTKDDGSQVVTFRIAESVARMNQTTKKFEEAPPNWFPVRTFGSLASRAISGLKKGDRVTVFGSLRTYQYEDVGGSKHYGFEVWANDVSRNGILPKSSQNPAKTPGVEKPAETWDDFNEREAFDA